MGSRSHCENSSRAHALVRLGRRLRLVWPRTVILGRPARTAVRRADGPDHRRRGGAPERADAFAGVSSDCRLSQMNTTRRLAAILAADVAGYSRLMAAD